LIKINPDNKFKESNHLLTIFKAYYKYVALATQCSYVALDPLQHACNLRKVNPNCKDYK